MVGVEEGVRKGWCSNLLVSDFDSRREEGNMGLSAGEFASASLCADTGEGIKDAQVHMRGGGGPQIAPPSHPYISKSTI